MEEILSKKDKTNNLITSVKEAIRVRFKEIEGYFAVHGNVITFSVPTTWTKKRKTGELYSGKPELHTSSSKDYFFKWYIFWPSGFIQFPH